MQSESYHHLHFNSQPHKEADAFFCPVTIPVQYFNSQPHKEADSQLLPEISGKNHFNSQPHKEADRVNKGVARVGIISTHSLTRRLTCKVL